MPPRRQGGPPLAVVAISAGSALLGLPDCPVLLSRLTLMSPKLPESWPGMWPPPGPSGWLGRRRVEPCQPQGWREADARMGGWGPVNFHSLPLKSTVLRAQEDLGDEPSMWIH